MTVCRSLVAIRTKDSYQGAEAVQSSRPAVQPGSQAGQVLRTLSLEGWRWWVLSGSVCNESPISPRLAAGWGSWGSPCHFQ